MNKITKEECINEIDGKWKTALIGIIIIDILAVTQIGFKSSSIWWLLFCIITFGALTIIAYYALRKKFKVVSQNNDFYIVEDVFINVQEKNVFANRISRYSIYKYGASYDYDIKFSRNGLYRTTLDSKKEPEELDSDYSAVFFSKPGDKFYLIMSNGKEKDNIIKAFNAKYYQIFEDDFDYVDGKYHPRKI